MPGNRPAPRRTLAALAALILILGICIPAVSADEILYDEELVHYIDTSAGGTATFNGGISQGRDTKYLHFNAIENYPVLSYIIADMGGNRFPSLESGENSFTYVLNGSTFTGTVYKSQSTNLLGDVTATRLIMFFDNWDVGGLSGPIDVSLSFGSWNVDSKRLTSATSPVYIKSSSGSYGPTFAIQYTIASSIPWKNHITIIEESQLPGYNINLERTILGDLYTSTINCTLDDTLLFTNTGHGTGVNVWYPSGDIDTVTVTNPHGTEYIYGLLETEPEEPDPDTATATVSVYVVDSQTGYLLQGTDTRIQMMNASAEWEEVFNQTNFAGSAKIPLEKTTDPDGIPYYWIQSTRAGYQQVPETQIFSVYGDRQVIVEMEPTGAPPVDPGNAFVEFYVFDWLHNPINHVAVKIGDEYLYTNRQGWVQYELQKNTTYTYTLTAPGYITTTGSVVVGADPRYRVDVEMQVGTVPTNTPTLAPGETPGATPTPDHRTNEQKGQAVIDMIADNAEGIGALGLLCLLMGLLKLLAKW